MKRHMSSKLHISRLNAHRYYMGLDLVDSSIVTHAVTSSVAEEDLIPMLAGVPALPLEPFLVLDGLDKELFPPSEVRDLNVHHFFLYVFFFAHFMSF